MTVSCWPCQATSAAANDCERYNEVPEDQWRRSRVLSQARHARSDRRPADPAPSSARLNASESRTQRFPPSSTCGAASSYTSLGWPAFVSETPKHDFRQLSRTKRWAGCPEHCSKGLLAAVVTQARNIGRRLSIGQDDTPPAAEAPVQCNFEILTCERSFQNTALIQKSTRIPVALRPPRSNFFSVLPTRSQKARRT